MCVCVCVCVCGVYLDAGAAAAAMCVELVLCSRPASPSALRPAAAPRLIPYLHDHGSSSPPPNSLCVLRLHTALALNRTQSIGYSNDFTTIGSLIAFTDFRNYP